MVTRSFNTKLELELEPVWYNEPPMILVKLNSYPLFDDYLKDCKVIQFDKNLIEGHQRLSINFFNKKNVDTKGDLDKAIKINSLTFMGIKSKKFIWKGLYIPQYPEPWATEQKNLGNNLEPILSNQTYLGWNGEWALDFTVPIFSWIHHVENLGWIYK